MALFELAMQGRAHVSGNVPCQDKTAVLERGGVRCIVLADGAGSACLSHFGARAVVDAVADLLCDQFLAFHVSPTTEDVKRSILESVREALHVTAREHGCLPGDLASTLLFAAVKDGSYIAGQLGDGSLVLWRNGELKLAGIPDRGEFANQTWFTTSAHAETHLHLYKGALSGITGFILMSDGAAESLYSRSTREPAPVIKNILTAAYCKESSRLEQELTGFFQKHILQRTTDDCSIACMATFDGYDAFFSSLLRADMFRLFELHSLRKRKKQASIYTRILMNSCNTCGLKTLTRLTRTRPKTLKKSIERLREMGFRAVMKTFY